MLISPRSITAAACSTGPGKHAKNGTPLNRAEVLILTRGKGGRVSPVDKEEEQVSAASEPETKVETKVAPKKGRKKGSKGAATGKANNPRNLEGSGNPYEAPCDRCYLKGLFCERPESGQGNCIPCKVGKLPCEYRQSHQQIGAATKKAYKDKRQGLNLRSKDSAPAGPSTATVADGEATAPDDEKDEKDNSPSHHFLFHDVDELMRSMADVAQNQILLAKDVKRRLANLEGQVSDRFDRIEKAISKFYTTDDPLPDPPKLDEVPPPPKSAAAADTSPIVTGENDVAPLSTSPAGAPAPPEQSPPPLPTSLATAQAATDLLTAAKEATENQSAAQAPADNLQPLDANLAAAAMAPDAAPGGSEVNALAIEGGQDDTVNSKRKADDAPADDEEPSSKKPHTE